MGSYEFISTRPGGIDRAIELSEMKPDVKECTAAHILSEVSEACEEIDAHPEELETPAQFQQRCNQIALNCLRGARAGRGVLHSGGESL